MASYIYFFFLLLFLWLRSDPHLSLFGCLFCASLPSGLLNSPCRRDSGNRARRFALTRKMLKKHRVGVSYCFCSVQVYQASGPGSGLCVCVCLLGFESVNRLEEDLTEPWITFHSFESAHREWNPSVRCRTSLLNQFADCRITFMKC